MPARAGQSDTVSGSMDTPVLPGMIPTPLLIGTIDGSLGCERPGPWSERQAGGQGVPADVELQRRLAMLQERAEPFDGAHGNVVVLADVERVCTVAFSSSVSPSLPAGTL